MKDFARSIHAAFILAAVVFGLSATSLAVNNGVEPHCSDTRYDAVGLLLKVNNPTVACSQNISGSCVLIDPQTVMVARHSVIPSSTSELPATGTRKFRVRFRRSADGAFHNSYYKGISNPCHGEYTEVYVHEFIRPANASMDVLMCRLETPINWIKPIRAETDSARMPAAGDRIMIAGWGYSGPCFRSGSALTLRVATGVAPNQNTSSCCIYLNPCSSPFAIGECYTCPTGGPWAVPNFLDSGAPVLIEIPCPDRTEGTPQLRVVGIVSTTNSAWKLSEWNRNGTADPIEPTLSGCETPLSDNNGDGIVDLSDLVMFLHGWLSAECTADLDESGFIDIADLVLYLTRFYGGN